MKYGNNQIAGIVTTPIAFAISPNVPTPPIHFPTKVKISVDNPTPSKPKIGPINKDAKIRTKKGKLKVELNDPKALNPFGMPAIAAIMSAYFNDLFSRTWHIPFHNLIELDQNGFSFSFS